MAIFFQTFSTTLVDGIATGDSQLVTMALYAEGEAIDPDDGAVVRIIDTDGDGLISEKEFSKATESGHGLNAGSETMLFDGTPPLTDWTGTLYSPAAVAEGTDLNPFTEELDKHFDPIDPGDITAIDPDAPPGDNPVVPNPVCFTRGTMILTPFGERPVEDLRPGDLVTTLDHGPQPLRWVAARRAPVAMLRSRPWLRPVQIAAGALAPGLPRRDLAVSPQHRVMLCSPVVRRMYPETGSVLVAAKKLLGFPGISAPGETPAEEDVLYIHLLFDRHEVVIANGAPVETLLTGPEALRSLTESDRREIEALFLVAPGTVLHADPARPIPLGRRLERLLDRHAENARPLCEDFDTADTAGHIAHPARRIA